MKPGRTPNPNSRRNRKKNICAPCASSNVPTCPKHLSPAAKAEWHRLAKTLHSAGMLTSIDGDAFALYANYAARWKEAEAAITRDGVIVAAPKTGTPMQHPMLSIANRAAKEMHRMLCEFGMTPAARTRVQIEKAETKDELSELMPLRLAE